MNFSRNFLPLLSVQDEEIRADRASAFDSIVLEAGLSFTHQGGRTSVHMDKLAKEMSAIYKGRGIDEEPSAECVGWAVKRLGIPSGRINRSGNGLTLNVSTCRLIHKLALSLRRARNAGCIFQRLSLLSRARDANRAGQNSSGGYGGCGGF